MKPFKLYCRICWSQFDYIEQHDAGSYYNGERLNGHCPGDIRSTDVRTNHRIAEGPMPDLPYADNPDYEEPEKDRS